MRKLMLLLMALLTVALLVSCGGEEPKKGDDNSDATTYSTSAETTETPSSEGPIRMTEEEKAKHYKVVEFDLPKEDFRDVIVNYMRKQSDIEWVCSGDFSVTEEFANWRISLDFKKGQLYRGIPYADTKVSYIQFQNALIDGTYTCSSSAWKEVYGVQCISSIMNSIQQFDPTVAGTSGVMMPGEKDFEAKVCGDYKYPNNPRSTNAIIELNGAEVMNNAYMQLKKGDIIANINFDKKTSHFRVLVEDATIYSNATGKVIPSRCYVKTIEQTNAFDSKRNDGVKTTWFVDHIYSFQDLLKSNYIPLTLESYSKSRNEMEIPYIAVDKEIDSAVLAKKLFNDTVVKSNFPLRYVQIDILNEKGERVTSKLKIDMVDSRKVALRNAFSSLFEGLESGTKYTLVLSAGIAIDSCELQRVDFTLN